MAYLFCNKKSFLFLALFICNACFAAPVKTIYVYDDAGASQESVKQTFHTLKETVSSQYSIKLINAEEVLKSRWTNDAALFVMPGGAATPYAKKLNGAGNAIIKQYVKNGGHYLGICAGAYYGSQSTEFDKGGALEVLHKDELAFFPGKAIGPVLAKYNYQNNSGARAALIKLKQNVINLYFNGGPYFQNAKQYPNVAVLGFYQINHQLLPAILKINYGKGTVILSGVHFEYSTKLLDRNDPDIAPLLSSLNQSETARSAFSKQIIELMAPA